ncbi:MAG: D-alanine--D-alanine ligase [Bacteroidaceae bacterium]|nr:D-alanine--D-alanine ligase [Bacteroidaceae bacterium]
MKKVIAIIAGGDSSEHDVSMRSAAGIDSWIDKEKYDVYIIEVEGTKWTAHLHSGKLSPVALHNFTFLDEYNKRVTPDYAYITIHGTPGENGILQGYFDLLKIPYSTSSLLVEAMTFDKFTLNQYLKGFGVKVAEDILVRKNMEVKAEDVVAKVGLPCFIKPNAGGSSFGVTKCKAVGDILPAIEKARHESDEVLIESEMKGTEISNGVYRAMDGNVQVLPITEVVPKTEFFDYDAKYNGQVEEITPARLSDDTTKRVQSLTKAIYEILGANGIIRIDYIISKNAEGEDVINMLEINTTPGMTATSFIPQQVRAAGLQMKDVLNAVIAEKLADYAE